ncbi:hypothetical protein [Amycolatopsis sp. NPDC049159]|uniref:hypothetical protein n=1 Tax=Amycolatopsis sp. NPDC049159 TaxID=3157210 RepID=UPI0033DFAD6E
MIADEHYETALRRWNAAHRQRDRVTGNHIPLTGADRIEIEQAAEKLRAAANPTPLLDERCELFDLPAKSCAHCRPAPPRPTTVDGRTRIITANYPGKCAGCHKPYQPGATIERLEGGGFVGPCCVNKT